jgi:hypothetical protein
MRNSTTYFTALTLFDTGAYTSFVNGEVAKWLELQQHGGTVAGAHLARSSRHDVPTSEVGLAGTQLSSSIYGTAIFDLTLFNEVTNSDNILIDSCIAYLHTSIVPTLLTSYHHKVTRNIQDTKATSRALCKGSLPCNNCVFLIERGHGNTLCSVAGRPNTPQCRDTFPHRMFTDDELIKKKDIFDPIEDDDDIDWKHNPFDADSMEGSEEDPEQLMSKITFEGSPQLQTKLKGIH